MAIVLSHLRFLLTQREFFPAAASGGRALILGVQDVHATHAQLDETIRSAGLTPVPIPESERLYTQSQVVGSDRRFAHVKDLFRMIGCGGVETLDFSDAERPDLVHDLNEPIPDAWAGQYDLLLDIGVVEHVCDVYQALANCMALVKLGGTVIHIVPLSGWHNMVFFNFQPPYFMEVYEANGFEPTQTFINFYPQYDEWRDRPMVYQEYRYGDDMIFRHPRQFTNLCFFARRSRAVERFVKPLQGFYLRYHRGGDIDSARSAGAAPDGRVAARVKQRLPPWLLKPLLSLNRWRLWVEDRLLPGPLRERLWCWRRQRFLLALDRTRNRKTIRI